MQCKAIYKKKLIEICRAMLPQFKAGMIIFTAYTANTM